MNTIRLHCLITSFLLTCVLFTRAGSASAQDARVFAAPHLTRDSATELKEMRRVLLLVTRSSVIDTRDFGKTLIAEAYRAADQRDGRRYIHTFNVIAKKLNGYIRRHHSLSAVEGIAEADHIIIFNLLEYRWLLGQRYPYGEMYVIVNQPTDSRSAARIIWRAKKVMMAEDATKELIKEMKTARGEK